MISAYWQPPMPGSFASYLAIPDARVGEVEQRLVAKLIAIRTKQPVQEPDNEAVEIQTSQLESPMDKEDIRKVR